MSFPSFSLGREAEVLESLLQGEDVEFTDEFRKSVPPSSVRIIVADLRGRIGEIGELIERRDSYALRGSKGFAEAWIFLDDEGRVGGLRFWNISSYEKDLNEIIKEIRAMPGEKSLAIIKNGKLLASINEDVPLAVASGFKVAVVLALEQAVRSRELNWRDVIVLRDEEKSLPTGISQEWPAGLHVTLETAAVLAVSLSDNTMSDVLMSAVGRERVESFSPHSRPFLTTREAFVLKSPSNAELADRFVSSSVVGRRKLLATLQNEELPHPSILSRGPVNLGVEWFFTAGEMAGMMMKLTRKEFFSISPPPFDSSLWEAFAYKGGWEPGVFSASAWMRKENGAEFAFSFISNSESPSIAVDKLSEITAKLAYALAHAE